MPKQKTHKGIRKRFKLTATGKVKHRKASRGHKLAKKGGKRTAEAAVAPAWSKANRSP